MINCSKVMVLCVDIDILDRIIYNFMLEEAPEFICSTGDYEVVCNSIC